MVPDMFLDEDGDNAYKELSEGPPLLPQPEIIKKDSIAIKVTTKHDINLIIPEYLKQQKICLKIILIYLCRR